MNTKFIIIIFLFYANSYSNQNSVSVNLQIEKQIISLKQKNDSLTKRLDEIEKNDYKSVEVIEKINDFYDKSWNKLIIFLGIAGSIILFMLPYLIAKNQEEKINLKSKEFEDLTNRKVEELEMKIVKFHQEQFESLKEEIVLTQEEINKNLESEIKNVQSYIFVLRGLIAEKDENYEFFFKHYIIALNMIIGLNKTKDIESLIKSINQRILKCLEKDIKLSENVKLRFAKLILSLENNYKEIFLDIIQELKTNSLKLKYE